MAESNGSPSALRRLPRSLQTGGGPYISSQGVLDDLILEDLLGQELLQPAVLGLQLFQALGVGHAYAAELAASQVIGGLAEAVLAAQVLHRHAGLRLTQEADDLPFGKALLHVQSTSDGDWAQNRCATQRRGKSRAHHS